MEEELAYEDERLKYEMSVEKQRIRRKNTGVIPGKADTNGDCLPSDSPAKVEIPRNL
jgi:hypothetical protein